MDCRAWQIITPQPKILITHRSIFVCNTAQRFYISYIYNKPIKKFNFIFSGLSLFTLVIVCVAEPNVDSEQVSTETREGKGKF